MRDKYGYRSYGGRKKPLWLKLLAALMVLGIVVFGALEVYIGVHSRGGGEGEPWIMVIFGCQVKPDGPSILLKDRLDTALDYLESHPGVTKIVVTGGKGDDEHISEAQCMYDYLTAHGVDGEKIYLEDQSRNTWQNITYTNELVRRELSLPDEEYGSYGEYVLVSSGFHLARIELLWQRGWRGSYRVSTLAAPVSHRPSAVQMFFREPLALVKSFIFDR